MKKATIWLILVFLVGFNSYSTTWNINVQNFFFNPASLPNVIVGDTVKWTWISGDHHTTTSLNIPASAPLWDAPLNAGSPTFSYVVTVAGTYQYKCTPHFPGMEGSFTANVIGITPNGSEIPQEFKLGQNYPNPFNPVTNIDFDIPRQSYVNLSVLSLLGQQVEVLVDGQLAAGIYTADWDAKDFPSGVYFYKLEADGYVNTKRMILIK